MRCSRARRYFLSFLDGELDPAVELDVHLERCPSCRRRLESEQALHMRFRSALGALDAPHRGAWTRARDAALPEAAKRGLQGVHLAGALAIGLLALVFIVVLERRAAEAALQEAMLARAEIERSEGEQESINRGIEPAKEGGTTMNPKTILGAAAAVSVVSAASTSLLVASRSSESAAQSEPAPAQTHVHTSSAGRSMDERLEELARRQADLEESVAELTRLLEEARAASREPVISESEVERLVDLALERRETSSPVESAPGDLALAAILRDLSDPGLDPSEKEAIWARVRKSGQIDAVLAEFERRAEASPLDSTAQTELGLAYFQKMLTVNGGPEAGRWGSQGAAALEHALDLDEANWDARFSLARHYFYAEMRGDAIKQFKILIDQQERGAPRPAFAETYLWLGNLYMDQGDRVQAIQTWSDGLRLFPTDEALRTRLKAFE